MTYSLDFRMCVVKNVLGGMAWEEAMRVFNVSRFSIGYWCRQYKATGSLEPINRRPYKPRKVDKFVLLQAIEATPDATLEELAEPFDVYPSTIDYHLKTLGITRKKNHAVHRARRGKKVKISG